MAIRRNPFELFDEMDRMMEGTRRSMTAGADESRPTTGTNVGSVGSGWTGAHVSVETDDEGYVVLADVPGFEKTDIDLRVEDDVLTIDAIHTVENESALGATARSRSMHETVRIPGEVDEDEITATYRNGVLEIRVPTLDPIDADEDGHRIEVE